MGVYLGPNVIDGHFNELFELHLVKKHIVAFHFVKANTSLHLQAI